MSSCNDHSPNKCIYVRIKFVLIIICRPSVQAFVKKKKRVIKNILFADCSNSTNNYKFSISLGFRSSNLVLGQFDPVCV